MAGWTMSELPFSWTVTELSNVGTWGSGGTPSRSNANNFLGDIPWAIIGDLNDDVLRSTQQKISKIGLSTSSAKLVPEKALLVAMYGSIGKLSITGIECATNQAIAFCIPDEDLIDLKYLFYALRYSRAKLIDLGQGAGQQNISQTILKSFEIPIAPLKEQQRIAQKLDALLAQVDTLKARIDALPALLKRFRQSAVSAWLSSPERHNEHGWASSSIADLCVTAFDGPFGSKLKSNDYSDVGVRVVRLENIGHLRFVDDKRTYVSLEKGKELSRNEILEGDVLFSSFVDEEVRVCQLPQSEDMFINKADCFCLRINPELADPQFVMLTLATRETYQKVRESVHGATRPRINLSFLKSFTIQLPPVDQQAEIVRRVGQLFAYADQLEAKVSAAQKRIDALTQSLLAKAFRGELVPQDPNDEPASVLLERIRAQRAATPKPKRGRKVATS